MTGTNPRPRTVVPLLLILSTLVGAQAYAGNIYLTGHDMDEHDGQAGYDTQVLDYLRDTIPRASYDIAVVGSGVGAFFLSFPLPSTLGVW